MTEHLRAVRRALRWLKKAEQLLAKAERLESKRFKQQQTYLTYTNFMEQARETTSPHSDQQAPFSQEIPQSNRPDESS